LVPSPSVLTAALKAARRVNDFPTAVRIFEGTYSLNGGTSEIPPRIIDDRPAEDKVLILDLLPGIKAKVENRGQYDQYLAELAPLREELGVSLKEDLYPEEAK
jgi:cytochrome c oxidase subunit 5a